MKKLLVIGLILLAASLSAQYGVYARFIDVNTGTDFTDVSTIMFEVELDPPSGDMQFGPSGLCFVELQDVGVGPQSFVQFDLANFANPYTPTSIVRIKIWSTDNPGGFSEILVQKDIDMDPTGGFLGWEEWFGAGGYPLEVEPGGGPTPVILSNFATAVFANEFVEISWTTESEEGNVGWNIYRGLSDDAQLASQINDVIIEGAGSTGQPTVYNFMDEYVENNTTYWYWLESINIDGTTVQYGPSTLNVEFEVVPDLPTATELLGNYPNPFNPVTEIKFNVKEGETAKLTIFDIKGRVITTATYGQGEQSYTWEANSSASGVYFYKLQSESLTSVKKMMLLK